MEDNKIISVEKIRVELFAVAAIKSCPGLLTHTFKCSFVLLTEVVGTAVVCKFKICRNFNLFIKFDFFYCYVYNTICKKM